jgi:hypothetical protein
MGPWGYSGMYIAVFAKVLLRIVSIYSLKVREYGDMLLISATFPIFLFAGMMHVLSVGIQL